MTAQPPVGHLALSVLAGGERVPQSQLRHGWGEPQVQQLLLAARQRYGHVVCTCRHSPLKLQVRLREGKFHIAVWPNEGPSHDSECMFFRDEIAEAVAANAPAPTPVPVTVQGHHAPARIALALAGAGVSQPNEQTVSVRGLAHRLWEAASLCRWHPTWTRDWGRTRYQLMQAASVFSINGMSAEEVLFIPRAYRKSKQDELNAEWDGFVRRLMTEKERLPRLLIAPVRRLSLAQGDKPPIALLRHLHTPIGLTPACADFMTRDCRNAISNSRAGERRLQDANTEQHSTAPELIGFFSVEGSSRGGVWARAGWLMPVHPTSYLPAASRDIVLLIDDLLEGGHAFQHLLSELPPSRRTTTDWLVRHVFGPENRPVSRAALEIVNRGSSPEYASARAEIARSMAAQGIPTWTWTPNGSRSQRVVPPLPPTDQTAPEAATRTLQQIATSPNADYGYGPSPKFSIDERKTA